MSYYTLSIRGDLETTKMHDGSITLLEDNKIIFCVQMERLTRRKHHGRLLDNNFVDIIKRYTNNINLLVTQTTKTKFGKQIASLLEENGITIDRLSGGTANYDQLVNNHLLISSPYTVVDIATNKAAHHLYHASSAFYMSSFKEAACIAIDAGGALHVLCDGALTYETSSIYKAEYPCVFQPKYKRFFYYPITAYPELVDKHIDNFISKFPNCEVDLTPHFDIGAMYVAISGFCGFGFHDAGKTMGLAPYGKPGNTPRFLLGNTTYSDNNLFRHGFLSNNIDKDIVSKIFPGFAFDDSRECKADMAYGVQKALEQIFVILAEKAMRLCNTTNIVLSGGCALNIIGCSIIKKTFPHCNVFVDPIAHDGTLSLGAGAYHYYDQTQDTRTFEFDSLFLGPEYDVSSMKTQLYDLVNWYNQKAN